MNFHNRYTSFSVIVGNGSGVLFQPMTEKYTYILTAKHNVEIDDKIITDFKSIDIQIIDEKKITIQNIYPHQNIDLDIVIIKINKINKETPLKYSENLTNGVQKYHFYGYPKYKRDENPSEVLKDKIENFNLMFNKSDSHIITLDNFAYSGQEEINACSGGGIFKEDEGYIYLVAVEFGMNASVDSVARHQRIDSVSIQAFDEIVEQYSDELAPLYPPFLNDFSLLLDNIFILNGMEKIEKELIQDRLNLIAENLSNKLKPIDIKKTFNILESHYYEQNHSNRELWSMYLEFIVISIFIDTYSSVKLTDIENINKKRKFLFLKTKDWKSKKKEILTSNFTTLDKNATVIVCCDGDRTPTSCTMNSKSLLKVGDGIMEEKFNIAKGINNPHKTFKFKHIHSIQKQMIDDYDDENNDIFDNANANNIEEIIRDEINKAFN